MDIQQFENDDTVKINHDFLLNCARNKELTKKSYRVLLYLLTIGDSIDFTEYTQKEIASALNMDKSSVSLALKSLLEEDIILNFPYGRFFKFQDFDINE